MHRLPPRPAGSIQHPLRAALAGLLLVGAHATAEEASYEPPPTLSASEVVPAELIAGPHYRVDGTITTDGYLTHAQVRSGFGDFSAIGPGSLEIRVREIEALAKLQELEQSEELKKGAQDSANKAIDGVKHFIDEPAETLKGIPEGVGRFFTRTYRSAKTGVQKLQDIHEGHAPGVPTESGPGSRLPGGAQVVQGPANKNEAYKAAGRAAGSVAVNALGFDDARRRLAKRLGVDPYTTNRVLAEKMDEVTWAAFAGDLGVDILTAMIPGGAVITSSTRLSNWVWDTPPGDLRVKIEQTLLGIGVSQADVDLLLRHRWYPLSLQASLALALSELEGVEGRVDLMPLALTVASEEQANYLVETLRMTARYHQTVKPVRALMVAGTAVAVAEDGELVVAAPVDYLSWNESLDRFARQEELAAPQRSMHLAGDLTERARTELEALGWAVSDRSPLFVPFVPPPSADG